MTQLTQSNLSTAVQINKKMVSNEVKIHHESLVKRSVSSHVKNSPKVPLRRVSSSQWPSTSHFHSSHTSNMGSHYSNAMENGYKVSNNAVHLHSAFNQQLSLEKLKTMEEELNKKTGEAKMLREENVKIRKEFFNKYNTLKNEAEQQRSSLVKEIRSLKTQLEVKDMEFKAAEVRGQSSSSVNRIQPDSPNVRHRESFRLLQKESTPDYDFSCFIKATKQYLPINFIRDSVMPTLLEPSQPEAPISEFIRTSNLRLFSGLFGTSRSDQAIKVYQRSSSTSKCDVIARCSSSKKELRAPPTSITACLPLLFSQDLVDAINDKFSQAISQVVDICHQILTELLKQLESVTCSNNHLIERERELLRVGFRQLPLHTDFDLNSHRELYNDERGIPARRALGLLSLLVRVTNLAAKKVLSNSKDRFATEILDTVRNIIEQIETHRLTLIFQGVLTGSVVLIRNLLQADVTISKETQTLMVDILRWVVSARPGSLVIRDILQVLLATARYPHIVNSLCHNSSDKTYREDTRHSIIQYTPESCILQLLCSLVKNAETPKKHILTDLFTLWMLSVFCGGQPRPQWLTTAPTASSCQCHSLLCKLSFTLLSEACFTHPSATGNDKKQLEKVLERGVLLVNTLVNEGEHLFAIVDSYSLGCYEHFLNSMGILIASDKIKLDNSTRDILHNLCTQEEVLKQPGNSTNDGCGWNHLMAASLLTPFEIGADGDKSSNVLEKLDSL